MSGSLGVCYASGGEEPLPLPDEAGVLYGRVRAPSRLVRHVRLVYDVSILLEGSLAGFGDVCWEDVRFGAATHDIGKAFVLSELSGSGHRHEEEGYAWLVREGVSARCARFARTHSAAKRDPSRYGVEECLVALCDALWRGSRVEVLEEAVVGRLVGSGSFWDVWGEVSEVFDAVALWGDQRLMWQGSPERET